MPHQIPARSQTRGRMALSLLLHRMTWMLGHLGPASQQGWRAKPIAALQPSDLSRGTLSLPTRELLRSELLKGTRQMLVWVQRRSRRLLQLLPWQPQLLPAAGAPLARAWLACKTAISRALLLQMARLAPPVLAPGARMARRVAASRSWLLQALRLDRARCRRGAGVWWSPA